MGVCFHVPLSVSRRHRIERFDVVRTTVVVGFTDWRLSVRQLMVTVGMGPAPTQCHFISSRADCYLDFFCRRYRAQAAARPHLKTTQNADVARQRPGSGMASILSQEHTSCARIP